MEDLRILLSSLGINGVQSGEREESRKKWRNQGARGGF